MNENFTIEKFIENRWTEAKEELERIAPQFVQTLQAIETLTTHRFVGLPDPDQRLGIAWCEVLESTFDVTQAVERLELTMDLLEGNTNRRLAWYYFEVWVQSAYILCEKAGTLIAHSCKINSINSRTRKGLMRMLNVEVRRVIDQQRTAIVHGVNRPGAGARPITATAITDNGWWEVGVFLGPVLIKNATREAYERGRLSPQEYYDGLKAVTESVLSRIGRILEQVDQAITR